jgi:hypothetical protein
VFQIDAGLILPDDESARLLVIVDDSGEIAPHQLKKEPAESIIFELHNAQAHLIR